MTCAIARQTHRIAELGAASGAVSTARAVRSASEGTDQARGENDFPDGVFGVFADEKNSGTIGCNTDRIIEPGCDPYAIFFLPGLSAEPA
jgi:uncharacterized 2Fe-2S/4Fe-4S cluster protein (DUF4445 family)